jgi:hypothetical protein
LYIIMQYKGKHPPPQIDADKDSVFWLANLHPSSIQVEKK